jgi:hypothetical protein
MVGDAYFSEIESSSHRVNVRLYAIEFIGEALWRGEPLTADQREALSQAIGRINESKKVGQPEVRIAANGLTDYDRQALDAAQGILSPQQLGIFEEVRREIGSANEQ